MAKYYKLGPKASQFLDPQTSLHIMKGEVVMDNKPLGKLSKAALAGGHIQMATKTEYEAFKSEGISPEVPSEVDVDTLTMANISEPILDKLSVKELKNFVQEAGFDDDDQATLLAIKKKSELVTEILRLKAQYDS